MSALAKLFDAIREFVTEVSPGKHPEHVTIDTAGGRAISLPVPPEGEAEFRLLAADGSSVVHRGTPYTFGAKAAAVVLRLWQAHRDGMPDVAQKVLAKAAGSDSTDGRLRDLFRSGDGMHPAWETLIVQGVRSGSFRLDLS